MQTGRGLSSSPNGNIKNSFLGQRGASRGSNDVEDGGGDGGGACPVAETVDEPVQLPGDEGVLNDHLEILITGVKTKILMHLDFQSFVMHVTSDVPPMATSRTASLGNGLLPEADQMSRTGADVVRRSTRSGEEESIFFSAAFLGAAFLAAVFLAGVFLATVFFCGDIFLEEVFLGKFFF